MTWLDPLTVDEEPWDPPADEPGDLLDGTPWVLGWWALLAGFVGAALVAVLALLGWLNRKLDLVETDPARNAWFDWADQELDRREARR